MMYNGIIIFERKNKSMNLFGLVAYADAGNAAADASTTSANPLGMVMSFAPLIIIVVLFYFMLIRPQRKRDKENKEMINALKVGDKIVTIGGICGKIVKIKDSHVFIESGNIGTQDAKSIIKMERDAIKSVEKKQTN